MSTHVRTSLAPVADTGGLVIAVAAAMADAAGVAGPAAPADRVVWAGQADEAFVPADAAYASVIDYAGGGEVPPLGVYATPVQVSVVGPDDASARQLAGRLFAALVDGVGRPRRDWVLEAGDGGGGGGDGGGYHVFGISRLTTPGLISRDAAGRPRFVFNFDLYAAAAPPAESN